MEKRLCDPSLSIRLMRQARPFWRHLLVLSVLSVVASLVKLCSPLPLLLGIDCVVCGRPLPTWLASCTGGPPFTSVEVLALAIVLLVALTVLVQLIGIATAVLSTYTGERLVMAFRGALFRLAQRLSLAYHHSRGTTDSNYRIQYNIPAIQRLGRTTFMIAQRLSTLEACDLRICFADGRLLVHDSSRRSAGLLQTPPAARATYV